MEKIMSYPIRGPPNSLHPFLARKNLIHPKPAASSQQAFTFKEIKMQETVEFKIRVPEVDRWGDTPVYISKTLSGTTEEIAAEAEEIAEGIAFDKHSEVRWNYKGQSQGHYQDEIFSDEEIIVREERILLLPAPEEVEVAVQ
jgi:hypothetical protein